MPLVATRALILQSFPYSDTSKILRLYTVDYGQRSVIAKGALRPKSRFGGVLELFTEGDAMFYVRAGRDLHTLGGFDLLRSRQGLGRDLGAFAGASLIAELLLRFTEEESNPALFRVASEAFDAILAAEREQIETVVLSAAWMVVALLGYQPETDACVTCGVPIESGDASRFDAERGGVACGRCRPSGRVLDPDSREELRRMIRGVRIDRPFARRTVHQALLRAFVSAHLRQEHPLRSLDLFIQQLPGT